MSAKNCWEFRKCGREPLGAHVHELGPCPAATEARADGVNGGKNAGRACWAIAGTMCGGKVTGTYASKIADCRCCEFYQSVHRDLKGDDPSRILDIVLERATALEHEIEQRKQVEEALRQANKKLNLLSSITRHDMLNKLHSVSLLVELLGRSYCQDPALAGNLSAIEAQLGDLEEMVWFTSDYQDLGAQSPSWQNIPDVIAGIRDWVRTIPLEPDPDLLRYEVYADPLLSKVFYNLADNAARHGERVSRIRVCGRVQPGGFVITWEDDGVGIPDEEKEKIFLKAYGKNTGLGLFLVREILSITGITITEKGVPGKGALFEMVVPEGSFREHEIKS
ncbi:HAMP domain-containing sensor histidine kinase [uncultured Methanoregula sp.]|uniref:sensor histidine kinase n=1 Tax=uncultured Methanoregula sp. TaxID=1005933 RepID=UPI002AAC4582|nr:HAMP domain-containing sensor histidine kinase [uncultured Methanoregula sp.]